MRNLRNIGHGVFRTASAPDLASASAITASCWDPASDELIVTYGPTQYDPRVELLRLSRDSSNPSQL